MEGSVKRDTVYLRIYVVSGIGQIFSDSRQCQYPAT